MTPIPLEEPTKKITDNQVTEWFQDLEDTFKKIPEIEKEEVIMKRMNNINTFHTYENDIYLSGTDELGKDFTICFDAYNFLNWIDTEQLEYIKEKLIKHIKEK